MKKFLFYTPFLKVGGIEKVTIEYLKLLVEKGFNVDLLVDYDMGSQNYFLGQVPSQVKVNFVKNKKVSGFIYFLRTLSKKYSLFSPFLFASVILSDFLLYYFKVKKLMVRSDYDATITFYQFLPSYITKHNKIKHFIWLHGSVEHFFGCYKSVFRKHYFRKLQKYDKVVTISEEMRDQLLAFYPDLEFNRVERIYNPLDFEYISLLSKDLSSLSSTELNLINCPFFCHVSRVDENQKDIETLLRSFAVLQTTSSVNHNLVIVGTGPDVKKLKELSIELGLEKKVFFVGNQLNPYVWMKHADILVLSSRFEGFGLVLVEAMAVDTFVIASNCKTGPNEILGCGRYGDLFEVGNHTELAKLIEHAVLDGDYRRKKIEQAHNRIHEFDRERTITQLISMIKGSNKL